MALGGVGIRVSEPYSVQRGGEYCCSIRTSHPFPPSKFPHLSALPFSPLSSIFFLPPTFPPYQGLCPCFPSTLIILLAFAFPLSHCFGGPLALFFVLAAQALS
ncbi:hypothetical protein BDW75DRAFT_70601 [Aspergillus navahoensis]